MIKRYNPVNFVPETIEEEYAMLIGRIFALEAYINSTKSDFIDKKACADILGIEWEEKNR